MTNMLLISLLLLLLLLIEQLFFVFCDIFLVQFLFTSTSFLKLHAYSDANHDNYLTHHKFVTSFCVFLNDYFIYWKNKKQFIISQSSTKTKYRATTFTTNKIV